MYFYIILVIGACLSLCSGRETISFRAVNGDVIFFNGMNKKLDLDSSEVLCKSIGGELVQSLDDVSFLKDILNVNTGVWLKRLPNSECIGATCCGLQARTGRTRGLPWRTYNTNCRNKAYQACRMTSLPSKELMLKLGELRRSDQIDTFLANRDEEDSRIKLLEVSHLEKKTNVEDFIVSLTQQFADPKRTIGDANTTVVHVSHYRDDERYNDVFLGCKSRIEKFDSGNMTDPLEESMDTNKKEIEFVGQKSENSGKQVQEFRDKMIEQLEQNEAEMETGAESLGKFLDDTEYDVKAASVRMSVDLERMDSVTRRIEAMNKKVEPTKQIQEQVEQLKKDIKAHADEVEATAKEMRGRLDVVVVPEDLHDRGIRLRVDSFKDSGYRLDNSGFKNTAIALLVLMGLILIANSIIIYRMKKGNESQTFARFTNEAFEG